MGKIKHINLFMNFHDKTVLFDGKHFYRAILIKFHCTLDSLPNIAVIITRGILSVSNMSNFAVFATDSSCRPESLPTFDLIR